MSVYVEYARTLEMKEQLQADLKLVEETLGRLEEAALDQMALDGVQHVALREPRRTLYQRRVVSARLRTRDRQAVVQALEGAGLGDLTKRDFNLRTLSGYFAEEAGGNASEEELNEALPPALRPLLQICEVIRVGARRS